MEMLERAVKALRSQPSNEHPSQASPKGQQFMPLIETYFDCASKFEEQLDIKSESNKLSNQL